MQVPMSWLRSLVDTKLSTADLAEVLTTGGIEVEEIAGFGAFDKRIVVGEVKEVMPVNKEQGIYVLTIDVGKLIPIVTKQPGDHALNIGARLAVARPGAELITARDGAFSLTQIKAGKLYQHESQGMLCAETDLGIGDENNIVFKASVSAKPGTPLINTLTPAANWLADEYIIIAILANIARCQSIIGMAREVAALTGAALTLDNIASISLSDVPQDLTPGIDDPQLCRRFSLAQVHEVHVTHSPLWLQRRLVSAGIDPINNIVDASNYVMLELGQPTHAYDRSKLRSAKLVARAAKEGDSLHVLTQSDTQAPLVLKAGQAVIADGKTVVAVAGVVGGTHTAINDDTQTVLLESANFDFISIRRAQADLKIFTDASARFSRGVNPTLTITAIERLVAILRETCPHCQVVSVGDNQPQAFTTQTIVLSAAEVNAALGMTLTIKQIGELLTKVAIPCQINKDTQSLAATIDVSREDIEGTHDLIEEIARLYGYDRMPETMPLQPIPLHPVNKEYMHREQVRDAMVLWGMQEVMSYALTSKAVEADCLVDELQLKPYVELTNPGSDDRSVLRRSLLPGLLQHLRLNLRHQAGCQLFEIGPVFLPEVASRDLGLPTEREQLTAVIAGERHATSMHVPMKKGALDFYDMVDAMQSLMKHLHIDEISLQAQTIASLHPGQCAEIMAGSKVYGSIGMLHPTVAERFDLDKYHVLVLDLDLSVLLPDVVRDYKVYAPAKYPSIELDISVVVDEAITAHWLLSLMAQVAGKQWVSGDVFDVYRAESLGANKKAVAIRFSLNANTRTMTMAEANQLREDMVAKLHDQVGASLRSD